MFGLLNVNKPKGLTSRDVVNRIQRLTKGAEQTNVKVGHAGTLDPIAQGVLVICLGQATRLIEYVQGASKRYVADFRLGVTSPSDDTETPMDLVDSPPVPGRQAINSLLPQFTGEIMQRPPAFSALKVKGRRAYQLARDGKQVDLAPRPVRVYSLEVLSYEYPDLQLEIHCGKGTYVRAIGRDLGEKLCTGGVMSGLVRTAIGQFTVETAATLAQIEEDGVAAHLLPASLAVSHLPQTVLSQQQIETLNFGRTLTSAAAVTTDGESAGVDDDGNLVAILTCKNDGELAAKRNFTNR